MAIINTSNLLFHLLLDKKFPVSLTQTLTMASAYWETLLGCRLVVHCPSAFKDQMEPRVSAVLAGAPPMSPHPSTCCYTAPAD